MVTVSLPGLAERLLETALRAGAEAADAIAVSGESISIDIRQGALEHAERSEGIEIGLRVLLGRKQACVSASDTAPAVMQAMAERAIAMAREAPDDPHAGLADPQQLSSARDAGGLELDDPAESPGAPQLQEIALRAEAAARALDGISQVDQASASTSRRSFHVMASNGFSGGYTRSGHSVSCVAITGTGGGMERDWAAESRCWLSDLPAPEGVGQLAAERTLARAGARKPPTGSFPVVFDERVAGSLVGHLLSAINGTAVARGASWLRDALGEPVLPDGIDLIEDPHRVRISGARLFDGEGLPTARRHLVRAGVLEGLVLDLATARKLGMQSTGNASRGTSAPPSPGAGPVLLSQGSRSRADLMREMGRGLLVTSMIGATINPTTGDYSRGAAGFWVEGGELAWPVNECTIAGNLRDMLRGLIPANDARPHLSTVVPSLLLEGLTIAGA